MNKDKRNNIQLLGTLNNADESGIIANANQVYDANEDKSTQEVSKEHKERIETLETKESSMQTTLENITKTGEASAASNVTYNHNDSQLDATNVQQAIDEVYSKGNTNRENDKTELEKSISDNKTTIDNSIQDVYKKSNYNDGDNIIDFNTIHLITDNPEYICVAVDADEKILYGIKTDGQPYFGVGCPQQVKDYIDEQINKILGTNDITTTIDSLKEIETFLKDFTNSDTLKNLLDLKANVDEVRATTDDIYKKSNPNDSEGNVIDTNTIISFEDNPEYIKAITDSIGRLIEAIGLDGVRKFFAGINIQGVGQYVTDNPEYIVAWLDSQDRIIFAIENDGNPYFGYGVPKQINEFVEQKIAELSLDEYEDIVAFLNGLEKGDNTLQNLLDEKVDKEEGKSLIDSKYASTKSTIDNPEFLEVKTDAEDKVLEGIQQDGTKVIGGDLNVGGSAKILGNMEVSGVSYKVIESPEYLAAWVDTDNKIIFGFKADGKTYVGDADFLNDIENIKAFLANITDKNIDWNALASITATENPEYIEAKTDSEGKLLAGRTPDGAAFENVGFATPKVSIDGHTIENIEDPEERSEITTDSEGKIISYRKSDGTIVENVGIEANSLRLSPEGLTKFEKDMKESGFQPGGAGDWSDYISNNGKNPLQLPIPQIAKINFICDIASLSDLSKADRPDGQEGVNYDVPSFVEYWDTLGNYFKKPSLISGQGNSTMNDPMRSISMDLFDSDGSDNAFAIKFGDWVAQDSFHVKAYYKDVTKGVSTISYKIGEVITKFLDARANRLSKNILNISAAGGLGKAKYDYSTNALCHPDGFPVEVYHNGNYYGLSVLSLKKHRANYSMDKNDYSSVLIDNICSFNWKNGTLNWSSAEIRNPKTLYCMDGTKYDGDNPKEIIDSTSQYYDSTNKNHVKSAEMKALVLSFLTAYGDIRNEQNVATRKNMWRQHFDIENAIAYIIFSNLTYNQDGWMNNAQVSIYNNKMGFNIYDCDSCLGKSWNGTIWSCSAKDIVIKSNTGHILFYIAKDFEDEIKAAYQALRDSKVIDVNNLSQFMIDWSNRIGYEAYKRSLDTWPNSPSYSLGNLNSEYWKQIVIGTEGLPNEYDNTVSYSKGDKCRIGSDLSYNTCIFECVKNTEPGQSPLTSGSLPTGCYDSPYRYKKWFELRISVLDEFYNYNI